jgi:hypothetical protein
MSARTASECRSPPRPHGKALPGQPDRLWSAVQNVIQVSSSHDRDQGTRTLAPRKQDSPRRGLHSERSKLGGCTIAPTGPRHVVLPTAYAARAPALGRVDIGLASLHRSLRLQAEYSGSKICHTSALSAQLSLQRILDWSPPTTLWVNPPWHLLPQVLEKLRASRAKGILIYPYWPLQSWFQEVQRLSTFHFRLPPPRLGVRPHHPGVVEPFVNRQVQLRVVVFDCA